MNVRWKFQEVDFALERDEGLRGALLLPLRSDLLLKFMLHDSAEVGWY